MYPAYCIWHCNPTLSVLSTSCFFPYLPILANRGLSYNSVLSFLNQNPPLGSISGETVELEDKEPIVNIMPHLSRHPEGIHAMERFRVKECRKPVRRYDTPRLWGSTWNLGKSKCDRKVGNIERVIHCIMRWGDVTYKIRYKLSTLESPEYILPVTPSISVTPVYPFTSHCSVSFHHPYLAVHSPSLSSLLSWVAEVVRNGFSHPCGEPRIHSY